MKQGVSDALVELSDLNPTICDLLGVGAGEGLDAESFIDVLHGRSTRHREYAMATHCGHHCVRDHQWKYVHGEDGCHELYNLQDDRQERVNLLATAPDQYASLHQQMAARFVEQWVGRRSLY